MARSILLAVVLALALTAVPMAANARKYDRQIHEHQQSYDYWRGAWKDAATMADKRHARWHMRRALRSKRRWQRKQDRHYLRGGTPAQNRRLGRAMARDRGWTGRQWECLRVLWNGESGWNHRARNASSGAFGIPQSLPASKLYTAGRAIHTPRVQIRWGLRYIAGRYGTPCAALAAWRSRSPRWY